MTYTLGGNSVTATTTVTVNQNAHLESMTLKAAPDGTPPTRTTVGVCEIVHIFIDPPMPATEWVMVGGGNGTMTVNAGGQSVEFEASDIETNPVIIAKFGSLPPLSIPFHVIPPNDAKWKKRISTNVNGTPGVAGCSMRLGDLTITPASVNFEGIEVHELSCAPSNIIGYFTNNPPFTVDAPSAGVLAGLIWHRAAGGDGVANGAWLPISNNNISVGSTDFAGWDALPAVPGGFKTGSFTWAIPMNYRKTDTGSEPGINFAEVNQVFTITENGKLTVTKDDDSICKVSQ